MDRMIQLLGAIAGVLSLIVSLIAFIRANSAARKVSELEDQIESHEISNKRKSSSKKKHRRE